MLNTALQIGATIGLAGKFPILTYIYRAKFNVVHPFSYHCRDPRGEQERAS